VPVDLSGVDLATESVRTGRLLLRAFRSDDIDAVHRASQDPEAQRWITAISVPYTREDARRFVEDVAPRERSDRLGLSVVVEDDDGLAGTAGIHVRPGRLGPEIGYFIAPWARSRGYATETARPRRLGARPRRAAGAPVRGRAERRLAGRGSTGRLHAGGCGAQLPGVPGRHPRRRGTVRPSGRGVRPRGRWSEAGREGDRCPPVPSFRRWIRPWARPAGRG
jgi:hypothetical protein